MPYIPISRPGIHRRNAAGTMILPEVVDMNGRFQMQGGKNWFLPKEMNANRFFCNSHWLEIWSNHFYPSMGPNGGSVAMDSAQFAFGTMYNADAPREWFRSINATFTVNHVTKSLTKFYWTISKQQAMLVDTIVPLCDNPNAVANPYAEFQNTVLHSYGLSAHQRTVKWLDHHGLGSNKPSVLMDQLNN
jgi:hypothetical protein